MPAVFSGQGMFTGAQSFCTDLQACGCSDSTATIPGYFIVIGDIVTYLALLPQEDGTAASGRSSQSQSLVWGLSGRSPSSKLSLPVLELKVS